MRGASNKKAVLPIIRKIHLLALVRQRLALAQACFGTVLLVEMPLAGKRHYDNLFQATFRTPERAHRVFRRIAIGRIVRVAGAHD